MGQLPEGGSRERGGGGALPARSLAPAQRVQQGGAEGLPGRGQVRDGPRAHGAWPRE